MKGWVGLVGWPVAMVYRHKWSPVSWSSAGQGKLAGQRLKLYHCATQPSKSADGVLYRAAVHRLKLCQDDSDAFYFILFGGLLRNGSAIRSFLQSFTFISVVSPVPDMDDLVVHLQLSYISQQHSGPGCLWRRGPWPSPQPPITMTHRLSAQYSSIDSRTWGGRLRCCGRSHRRRGRHRRRRRYRSRFHCNRWHTHTFK